MDRSENAQNENAQSETAQSEKPASRKLDRHTMMVIGAFVLGLVLLIAFNMK